MKILTIGDVVGRRSIEHLSQKLRRIRNSLGVAPNLLGYTRATKGGTMGSDTER